MNWFFIALSAPAVWSLSNHIDKYLLSNYVRDSRSGALIIFSALFGLFALPVILATGINVWELPLRDGLLVVLSGVLYLVGLIPYFYALAKDEASSVVPIFQTIPIFGFILAALFLGEVLTSWQLIGSLVVICGAVIISLDLSQPSPKIKTRVLLAMLLSSIIFALVDMLFKLVAIDIGFWLTIFWHFAGYVLFAIFVFIFVPNYRNDFLEIMKRSKVPVIGLNAFNEVLNLVARGLFGYATLLAPLALVQVTNGFQPVFVFIYGALLTLFFPKIVTERLSRKDVIQKVVCIAIIFLGSYLLNR